MNLRIVCVCMLAGLPLAFTAKAVENAILKSGTEAPTFSLPGLDGNREVLRTWCGTTLLKPHINAKPHTVIVSFWATWCKPCQKEIPELIAFMKNHKNDPVKSFCVSIDKEGASIVDPFIKEKKWDIPILLDPYAKTAERYGVKTVPALFVIAPDGIIYYSATGFDDKTDLTAKLEELYGNITAGKKAASGESHVSGEAVAVPDAPSEPPPEATVAPQPSVSGVPPQARWKAVARVECGESVEKVAGENGVTVDELKKWYQELKKAAMSAWGQKSDQ